MARFAVRYSPQAEHDLQSAYDWGVENWGVQEAAEWVEHFDLLILKRLSLMPTSCPPAPEDPNFDFELRQLVIRRYRVLFRIVKNSVFILRIRGPFSGGMFEIE
ncbi:MAG: type II toxin-antitoxin system RelE/ParE family toxin [Pyrinomonadaceae bacterium]